MFPQDPWNGQQPGNHPDEPGYQGGRYQGGGSQGGGYQGGGYEGGAYPGGAYPGGAYPGGAYPGGAYPGGAYQPGPGQSGQPGYPSGFPDPVQQTNVPQGPPPSGPGPSRNGRVVALVVGAAVLVAALTVTLVLVLRPKTVADPGLTPGIGTTASTQVRPVEPTSITTPSSLPSGGSQSSGSDQTTTSSESTGSSPEDSSTADSSTADSSTSTPTTSSTATSAPTTTTRTTSRPPTTSKSTPRTSGPDYAAIQQAATAGARAWADAVNTGNYDGVVAHSCKKDQAGYKSGGLTNPAILGGHNTFTVQTVVASPDKGIVIFKVVPALSGHSTETIRLLNEAGWKVCLS